VTKRPSLERANARIRQVVGSVHALVDAEHERPEKQHAGVQCREGCAHAATGCCSTIVLIELAEAEYIVDRNREHVERTLPALLEADERIRSRISPADVAGMFSDKAAELRVAHEYHALGIPCPFLSAEQVCTIYRDRPIPCRTHFVLSEPAECSAMEANPRHVTLDKGTRLKAPEALVRSLMHERPPGAPLQFGTLPQLVLLALRRRR
jgi:Fe-S-cluster containining protein